ncbi:putative leucine-rich repeat domain, L domain-containing protein [Lupinus albus]|uniref:Putative leucine-rich repeat domain, L domain-containing protein n=1 Tax=Lupinus albus TaxID=3870 RepID=A0A6A4Q6A7_LUPAL|nr:putative leucine-rich repeat domain, L domain-containing protein [Lupinus albus]
MAICNCISILIGRKGKKKVRNVFDTVSCFVFVRLVQTIDLPALASFFLLVQGTERDSKTPLVKLQHSQISSEISDLKSGVLDVVVPSSGIRKNSKSNLRVTSIESLFKAEDAYEREDEHDHSPFIKRELSDFDLQAHEVVMKYPSLYQNKAKYNIQLEEKKDTYSKKSVDTIQSGHVSDPGIGNADFSSSPKITRSCSNLERRDVLSDKTLHFISSNPKSFGDLQELSANQMANLLAMTHGSADRVMLERHSSSQLIKSTQLRPSSAALKNQCEYSSDTIEPNKGKALMRIVDSTSPGSSSGEYFLKSGMDKNTDNQRWGRFYNGNFSSWPQNPSVTFTGESSSFNKVDEWVKDLEIQQPLPEDDFVDDIMGSIVYPHSQEARTSMARNTAHLVQQPDVNLSNEILITNSIVQSLDPASTVAHLPRIGIKVIPAISHFSGLRYVNLSSNFIVNITPRFLPKGIHTLNLSRNKISTIEGLKELTRLRVLDLSYNRISRIGQG